MNIEEMTALGKSFPGVTTDIKWKDHLCFNVAKKMFLIVSLENVPTTASFKASEDSFHELTAMTGFSPAPYLARYNWVHIDDISRLSQEKWDHLIAESYQLVVQKLPKKVQREIHSS